LHDLLVFITVDMSEIDCALKISMILVGYLENQAQESIDQIIVGIDNGSINILPHVSDLHDLVKLLGESGISLMTGFNHQR